MARLLKRAGDPAVGPLLAEAEQSLRRFASTDPAIREALRKLKAVRDEPAAGR